MSNFLDHRIREGGHRFELYNEGNVIFLYDLGSRDRLREIEAVKVVLEDVENRNKRLKAIEQESLIVSYELLQDDSRQIELAIGIPLTSKEKKSVTWFKGQKTLLKIPSGKLRFESPNSLTIGDEEPTDEGVTLDVLPGEYVLTLERVNWEAMEEDGQDRPELPMEFISLCPVDQAKPQKPKSFLSWGGVVGDKARWESEWKVRSGVFIGNAKSTWSNKLAVNFTPGAAQKLGARVGSVLHLMGEGFSMDFIYYGVRTAYGIERAFGKELATQNREVAPYETSPQYAETPGATLICFEGPGSENLPIFAEPSPITIMLTGKYAFPPSDNRFVKDVTIGKGLVEGRVLSCSTKYLNINILPAHLQKLGYEWGQPMQLTIKGDTRDVYIDNDFTKVRLADAKVEAASNPSKVGLDGRVMNHWEIRGQEIWDLTPIVGNDLHLDAKAGDKVEVRI